jgi:hypothetical protein
MILLEGNLVRLIHKQPQKMASEKYGLETIFGFTDSVFIKNARIETLNELIIECKNKYHVTLEHKNRFINTIIFDKKNRFVAWTGNSTDTYYKTISLFGV